ncbi:MAG TPA: hypothetical protein VHQ22_20175 [Terriglobales bacterium]|nr:hypothetical protein [Terriglobales bacterium]
MILETIADFLVAALIPSPRSRLDSHAQEKLQPQSRVIPNSFAEVGRERDRALRIAGDVYGTGASLPTPLFDLIPKASEELSGLRKVPLLPSFGVQVRDDSV